VRFDDVTGMAVSPSDLVAVAERSSIAVADRTGERLPPVPIREPRAVAYRRGHESLVVPFREDGGPVFATERTLHLGRAGGVLLKIPDPSDVNKAVGRVSAIAHTWKREWLVADPGERAVWVYSDSGEFVRPFLPKGGNLTPNRMAINVYDEVAILDGDRRAVTIFDRDGEPVRRIEERGTNHRFDRPVDIAFDPFGHLYVLDRGRSEVIVFGARPRTEAEVIATFTSAPQRDPAAFRRATAMVVDSRGRLHIYDDELRKVQVYQ
jgi:hypothetical protein